MTLLDIAKAHPEAFSYELSSQKARLLLEADAFAAACWQSFIEDCPHMDKPEHHLAYMTGVTVVMTAIDELRKEPEPLTYTVDAVLRELAIVRKALRDHMARKGITQ